MRVATEVSGSVLPNTFIAGAQKSGTTTLCSVLALHPQVLLSEPKEPIFFSRAANLSRPEIYEACFQRKRGTEPRVVIDGSNAYMADPEAAFRIREMLGDSPRFIFSLREPFTRMVSAYWHQAKKGHDHRTLTDALSVESTTLQDAVQEEEHLLRNSASRGLIELDAYSDRYDDPFWNFRYVRNSLYASDLQRFRDIFGAKQVLVLVFEDLVSDPLKTFDRISQFLCIDPVGFSRRLDLHHNPTRLSRVPRLLSALQRLPGRRFLRALPGYARLSNALFYRRPNSPPADFAVRWRCLYVPEVARLGAILNRDLRTVWIQNDASP